MGLAADLSCFHLALRAVDSVDELFAVTCETLPTLSGCSRALVLGVAGDALVCAVRRPLCSDAGEQLRRRSLSTPLAADARIFTAAASDNGAAGALEITALLGLGPSSFGIVAPAGEPLAVLVLDWDTDAEATAGRDLTRIYAHVLGLELERLVAHLRLRELSMEFRHLTSSAHALLNEAMQAPIGLTVDLGPAAVFTQTATPALARASGTSMPHQLTEREASIASLLVDGRTNREIGETLHLAPDTVKTHVSRVVRKLGASNRVDAAARYMAWTIGTPSDR